MSKRRPPRAAGFLGTAGAHAAGTVICAYLKPTREPTPHPISKRPSPHVLDQPLCDRGYDTASCMGSTCRYDRVGGAGPKGRAARETAPSCTAQLQPLDLPADHGLTIFTYAAEPGSRSDKPLKLPGSWAATVNPAASARLIRSEASPNAVRRRQRRQSCSRCTPTAASGPALSRNTSLLAVACRAVL